MVSDHSEVYVHTYSMYLHSINKMVFSCNITPVRVGLSYVRTRKTTITVSNIHSQDWALEHIKMETHVGVWWICLFNTTRGFGFSLINPVMGGFQETFASTNVQC